MNRLLILALLLLSSSAMAQQEVFYLRGKVFDEAKQQPLAGASVFAQNTTIGTITNADGEFTMRLPNGGYDLIVSYTGFESGNLRISNSTSDTVQIMLKQTDKTLSEVVVSGSTEVADGLEKYGKFFLDHFIGTTPNAALCKIENPEALQFFYSKKRNRLKVKGKEDLLIVNNALGYRIRYQLDSFSYEYATDISMYSGYPFYEEMEGTETEKAAWKENRSTAYNGSRLHFLRSWYDSTLQDEGFRIEWVDTAQKRLTTVPIANPYDSIRYTVVEDGDVEINQPGRVRVIYTNEMPDQQFLRNNKLPLHLRAQISMLDIADVIVIEQNGYVYEQSDILNTGYWSWEKLAELLPYDYEPEGIE
jgi:hypothetical protein